MKYRVLSGMRPTGRLHLGNYLGAAKGMLELQANPDYETYYTVVDLHATTTPYDPATLAFSAREVYLDYLAIGLDPEKSVITIQSDLADLITQLSFYFSTVMSVARMQHLPTFKEKVKQYPQHTTMALLNYPMLMAADILIYKAHKVPVGIDQEPHIEVAREVARKMNSTYGTDFPEPERFSTKGEYVPSLLGVGKMSKTVTGSYILITDDLKTIQQRLASVPTDSGQGQEVPKEGGLFNLLELVSLFQGDELRHEYEKRYLESGLRYNSLKQELAQAIFSELEPIQQHRLELLSNAAHIDQLLADGAHRARAVAAQTLEMVRESMGFK